MYSGRPHPYLAQIPLTVSPFISLPTATTLPYTYKALPSTLPPSSTADSNGAERDKYIVSPSGHTAHPDEIIASCQALQTHIQKVQEDADQTLRDWEARLEEQELVEKRRVAPGWLDRDEKILEPERQIKRSGASGQSNAQTSSNNMMDWQDNIDDRVSEPPENNEGNELDRAFGGLVLQKK